MTRATPAEARLPKLSEAQVTKQIRGWLAAKGWDGYRMQSGVVRGVTQGTFITLNPKGTPDWFFLRGEQILAVEMKAPKKKLSADQERWFENAKREGTPAIWADSLEVFEQKYREAGLQ